MPVCASTISTRRRCARPRARRCSPGAIITASPPASSWSWAPAIPGYNTLMPQEARHVRRDPQAERLQHGVVRQEPQRARLADEPGRSLRPLARRAWASNISMASSAATPTSGRRRSSRTRGRSSRRMTIPDYNLRRRHGRQGDRLAAHAACHGAQQAVLRLLRARHGACAASRAQGVDREVQGQVRPGLGQAARG